MLDAGSMGLAQGSARWWSDGGVTRMRAGWMAGPQHQRILMDVGLGVVFAYLSVSSFWRAERR